MPYYDAHKEDKTAPYPGIPDLLHELKRAGVNIAVLSNKAHQFLGPLIWRTTFPACSLTPRARVDGIPTKPDPTLLHRLMEEMGASQESTLFVGDSNVDVRTAKNGGLTCCGVLWGFRGREELEQEGADFLAENTDELKQLILK